MDTDRSTGELTPAVVRNRMGRIALLCSAAGVFFLFVCSNGPLMWFLPFGPLLCPVGMLLGVVAVWKPPKRDAAWAIGLGLFGTLHLPTIWLFYLHAITAGRS